MATQKFTDLTATTTPNTESVFAIAYSGSNFKLTITDLAANLPAVIATSLTSSGTLTTTSNATIGGDLTISGDDLFMATNTSGAALIADGTNFNPVVISGDISIGSTGTAAIGTGVIVNADVNASAAIDASKIHDGTVSNTEFGYLNGVSSAIQTQMDTKITASSTDTLTNKSGNISQWTNDSGYLTSFTETNDLSSAVTWANVPDANITQSSVTQHQAALSITESQISDLGSYITASSTDTLTNKSGSNSQWTNDAGYITASGNAATATALETARNIGGVSFDGTANIDLPGVNTAGNQNTSGSAASLSATLAVASGGTNITSYTTGDIIYASASGTLSKLPIGSTGQVLTVAGGIPSYAATASTVTFPTVSSISPSTITNDATSITITGTNFVNGCHVEAISSTGAIFTPNSVSFTNATTVVANFTIGTDGTYFIRVENPDGLAARSSSALLTVSDAPTWSTSAGSLGEVAAGESVSLDVDASSDSTVTFSETTSVLTSNSDTPASTMNLSLNSSTGAITGTAPSPTSETTYNFTLRATDAEAQTADRAFSITVSVGMNNSGQFN
jgi:hypothetical protein